MDPVSHDMRDVVSAILALAGARIIGGIPRWAIHAIFWRMRREEAVLSGLRFTITGDVCYSKDIDAAIDYLLARGILRTGTDGAILPGTAPALRFLRRARGRLPDIPDLLGASWNFCQRFERWTTSASRRVS